jgi:hypothetical protein
MTADAPARVRRKNPYVGPRAFRADEALYGRERECRELTDLLIAERIVLVHSPSGAGKTSLIQSRVIPRLTREGFTVSPVLRVNTLSTKPVANRWVYSVVLGLVGEDGLDEWPGLENATIPDVLNRLDSQAPGTERVLVFDQFEEILRIEPTDWHGQTEFFEQLGAALVDGSRWALFSMREDFVGGLDRYVCYLPGHLRTWYRLDFLQKDAALRAIQKPAEDWGAKFTDEAAEQLFDDLARVDVEVPNRELEKSVGPYVEPVHLQVACHRLWRALKNERSPQPVKMITADDVTNFAEIDTTLAGFYSDAVTDVVAETHVDERTLRDWFEKELITVERWRSQTRRGPSCSPVDVATVLGALEDRYLIRSDRRAGVIWYELTHDRLINPVLRSNKDWRRTNLHWIQYRAYEWDRKGRDDTYLLPRDLLAEAQVWLLTHRNDSRDLDCQFINESRERNGQTILLRRLNRLSQLVILLIVVVIVEAAVILYLMPTT